MAGRWGQLAHIDPSTAGVKVKMEVGYGNANRRPVEVDGSILPRTGSAPFGPANTEKLGKLTFD